MKILSLYNLIKYVCRIKYFILKIKAWINNTFNFDIRYIEYAQKILYQKKKFILFIIVLFKVLAVLQYI